MGGRGGPRQLPKDPESPGEHVPSTERLLLVRPPPGSDGGHADLVHLGQYSCPAGEQAWGPATRRVSAIQGPGPSPEPGRQGGRAPAAEPAGEGAPLGLRLIPPSVPVPLSWPREVGARPLAKPPRENADLPAGDVSLAAEHGGARPPGCRRPPWPPRLQDFRAGVPSGRLLTLMHGRSPSSPPLPRPGVSRLQAPGSLTPHPRLRVLLAPGQSTRPALRGPRGLSLGSARPRGCARWSSCEPYPRGQTRSLAPPVSPHRLLTPRWSACTSPVYR